jgi:hypothetical protein
MHCNNAGVYRLVLEKTNSFEFFIADGDAGYACKLSSLRSSQVGAVDNPVVITAAVEAIPFSQTVGKHFTFVILLPCNRVGRYLLR